MDQARKLFVILLASVLVVLGGVALFRYVGGNSPATVAAPAAVAVKTAATNIPAVAAAAAATTAPAVVAPAATLALPAVPAKADVKPAAAGKLKPVFSATTYKEGDGLPTISCGTYAFSADYVLHQIQMTGLDIKNGFHLGIVPFYLDENYIVTAKERTDALHNGTMDCLLGTFDLIALEDPGVLTAFINESAGGDAIWARGLASINDMKGKRIAFEANGPSAFFVYDLLNTVGIKPGDVTLLPQSDQFTAIKVFNKGDADVVAGWEPTIFGAKDGGGKVLATSKEFRSILGGIVFSSDVIKSKRAAVQAFHDTWFQALDVQEKDFPAAAKAIASWGHNDYLGVQKDTAEADLRNLLGGVAQASLGDNARAFADVPVVTRRLQQARGLWALNGLTVPTTDVSNSVDPSFVLASARAVGADPEAVNGFVNNSFSLGRTKLPVKVAAAAPAAVAAAEPAKATAEPTKAAPAPAQVLATLPCKRFDFLPNSSALQPASASELTNCAVGVLTQNISLVVRVKGSAAWPGPKGTYTQQQVEETARARAQAIADFLVSKGINKDRLVVQFELPPDDHRETSDIAKQSDDRFVEIALLASGL